MDAGDYLGQEQVRVTVAPVRAGYVVRPGDRSGTARAISAATRRWGGITEPLLPIGDDGAVEALALEIAETLAPDVLVAVDSDRDLRALSDVAGREVVPWSAFGQEGDAWPPRWCHPAKPESDSAPVLISVAGAPLRDLAGSGAPDPSNGWSFFQRAGVTSEKYTIDLQRAADTAYRAQLGRQTPLWATLRQFREQPRGTILAPPVPALVWFAEPESINDVIGFWNARALIALTEPDQVAILLPPSIEPWLRFDEQVRDGLGKWGPLRRCRPDAAIFSHSVPAERLKQLADHLQLRDITAEIPHPETYPLGDREAPDPGAPLCATVGIDPTPWLLYPRSYGAGADHLVQLFRRQTTVDVPWPISFSRIGGGTVRASVSGLSHLELPRRAEVARAFKESAYWQPGEYMSTLSFIAPLGPPTLSAWLNIPEGAVVLERALAACGARFEPSDKGKYGLALLERAPQISALVDSPRTVEWIRKLATASTTQFTKLLTRTGIDGAVADEIVQLAEEHFKPPFRTVGELGSREHADEITTLLESLAGVGLVARGLAVRCQECLVRSFIGLADVSARPTCPACDSAATYCRDGRDSGLGLHYRLNALLDRAANGGVLPTLAAMGRLAREAVTAGRSPLAHLIPGADVYVADSHVGEIDILGFIGRDLVAGEVKTSAQDFTDAQIDKDLTKVAAVGAEVYVVASSNVLDQGQRDLAEAKAKAVGIRLLILDTAG